MYYYGKKGWTPISHEYQVWIGKEPPRDKKALWVDTRIIEADPNKQSTQPPIIRYLADLVGKQNNTIINLSSQISILENEINLIKQAIENGGGGIVDSNTYLTTEDGDIFITEDGIPIISEESNNSSSGGSGGVIDNNIYLTTEDDNIFTTEDGVSFISEEGNSSNNDNVVTTIDRVFLAENGNYLLTEDGKNIKIEDKT